MFFVGERLIANISVIAGKRVNIIVTRLNHNCVSVNLILDKMEQKHTTVN